MSFDDGRRQTIAHVDLPSLHRVGRYGVDVRAIDDLAAATLVDDGRPALYLVDEIGKMECLSGPFVVAVRSLLDRGALLVATLAKRGSGLIAEVRARPGVELWELTLSNRGAVPGLVQRWLAEREGPYPGW